jgi:hypothetical protein
MIDRDAGTWTGGATGQKVYHGGEGEGVKARAAVGVRGERCER